MDVGEARIPGPLTMEADVVLPTTEKWIPGESRFESQEKGNKYLYSSRKKEKEARAARKAARLQQIKPSKSFDNEIEASMGREAAAGRTSSQTAITEARRIQDDLSYGYRGPRYQLGGGESVAEFSSGEGQSMGRVMLPRGMYSSEELLGPSHSENLKQGASTEQRKGAEGKKKWKPKEREGRRKRENAGKERSAVTEQPLDRVASPPFTFLQYALQENYSAEERLLRDSPPLRRREMKHEQAAKPTKKSSPLVVLEVKDGPTLMFKPSEQMVSDTICPETLLPNPAPSSSIQGRSDFTDTTAVSSRRNPKDGAKASSLRSIPRSPQTEPAVPPEVVIPAPSVSMPAHAEVFHRDVPMEGKQAGLRREDTVDSPTQAGCVREEVSEKKDVLVGHRQKGAKTKFKDGNTIFNEPTALVPEEISVHKKLKTTKQTAEESYHLGERDLQTEHGEQNEPKRGAGDENKVAGQNRARVDHSDTVGSLSRHRKNSGALQHDDIVVGPRVGTSFTVPPFPGTDVAMMDTEPSTECSSFPNSTTVTPPSSKNVIQGGDLSNQAPYVPKQPSHAPIGTENASVDFSSVKVPIHTNRDPDQFTLNSLGFQNSSVISQQKAGVRHDDIVVGPRRGFASAQFLDESPKPSEDVKGPDSMLDQHSSESPTPQSSRPPIPKNVDRSPRKTVPCHDDIVVGPRARPAIVGIVSESTRSGMEDNDLFIVENENVSSETHPSTCRVPVRHEDIIVGPKPARFGFVPHRQDLPSGKQRLGDSEAKLSQVAPSASAPVSHEDIVVGPKSNKITRAAEVPCGDTAPTASNDPGRWRPKEKKSGIHRMRRGKKEESVSTESGYATDLAKEAPDSRHYKSFDDLSSGGVKMKAPLPTSGRFVNSIERKPKPRPGASSARKSNQHDLSGGDSKSKSKSLNTAPKRKGIPVARTNALSNIPVPMSHDPPAKRPPNAARATSPPNAGDVESDPCVKGSFPPKQQARVEYQGKTDMAKASSVESSTRSGTPQKPATSDTQSSKFDSDLKRKTSVDKVHTSKETPKKFAPSETQVRNDSRLPSAARKLAPDSRSLHEEPTALTATSTRAPASAPVSAKTTPSQTPVSSPIRKLSDAWARQPTERHPAPSSVASSSTTSMNSNAQEGETLGSSEVPPSTVRPRLHRSAEHLFGQAKLTVYHHSSDNIPDFEPATPAAKASPLDTKIPRPLASPGRTERSPKKTSVDSISPLRRKEELLRGRNVGLLRRESDRGGVVPVGLMGRRGSDRAIVVGRNDPSGEDLKKATSLKELCQSMASLLNIDNERAVVMLTTPLSQRQDLVEGLDADAILDYLTHHGVLDPGELLGHEATPTQRNSSLLKHVEEHGNTAVALFINALRQSGQLHLASSLDTEQRIKPVSGEGYFGKQRHKGEVTIRVELEALKILAPREPPTERNVNMSLLSSPTHHTGNTPEESGAVLIVEDGEEDFVKPRSCWCFCFSRKSKSKSSSKKRSQSASSSRRAAPTLPSEKTSDHEEVNPHDPNVKPHRTKPGSKEKKGRSGSKGKSDSGKPGERKKNKPSKSKSKTSSGNLSVPETLEAPESLASVPDVVFSAGREEVALRQGGAVATPSHLPLPPPGNGVHSQKSDLKHEGPRGDKDSLNPIIMEYDPKLELVKLRAGQEELASPTRQMGPVGIMVEQWKSSGKHFLQKAEVLCDCIVEELHTEIIKYFEQDRGTLVLDVVSDGTAIIVFNICMTRIQVKKLQQDYQSEELVDKLESLFFPKVDISKFDIRGVKLRTVIEENHLQNALSELS